MPIASPHRSRKRFFADLLTGGERPERRGRRRRTLLLGQLLESRRLLAADLIEFTPDGWSDSIVISSQAGTTVDDAPITTADAVFVDFAFWNRGSSDAGDYDIELQVDDLPPAIGGLGGLPSGFFQPFLDINLGTLAPGPHKVTVTIDSTGLVAESNEANNTFSKEFFIGTADFGDAPSDSQTLLAAAYPTLLSDDGPYHTIVSGFSLGSAVDADLNGQPNLAATGDDSAVSNDEQGVSFSGPLAAGETTTATVTVTNTAVMANPWLDAWVDFNRDGDWSDAGENIFSGAVVAGDNAIDIDVPVDAVAGSTYARFRLHDGTSALAVTGGAADGEVEDYALVIAAAAGQWQSQGPTSTQNAQVENVEPGNQVTGAIHTVLAHPTDADVLYVGTVNGGIWKTTNATAANPTWVPQTDFLESLSIGAMAFDPTDATHQTLVAGTAQYSSFRGEGGRRGLVYRTTDGGDTWTQLASAGLLTFGENLSGIAARGNTIVVTSSVNSGGIFRSIDGGATFTPIDGADFNSPNDNFTDLVVDPSDPSGQRLYAASEGVGGPGGIYRSDDFGATWTKVSGAAINAAMDDLLLASNNVEMAVHPTTGRLYAAVLVSGQPQGIFYSDNAAALAPTWTQMDVPVLPLGSGVAISGASNATPIQITSAAHGLQTGQFVVINGVTGNTAANGFYRITRTGTNTFTLDGSEGNGAYTGGGTWTRVTGPSPTAKDIEETGAQGRIHFSITVDPANEDIVYIGGDRQDQPNAIGDDTFGGAIFRGDASVTRDPTVAPSPQWDHITHDQMDFDAAGGTASGSSPHADSREIAFDAAGNLIEVDDGGIFKRTSPGDNTGDWFSLSGTLGVVEFHDIAYDSLSGVIIGGTQDNGTHYQLTEGGQVWDFLQGGDGGDVAVDNVTLAGINQSIRYSSSQYLQNLAKTTWDELNNFVGYTSVPLTLAGGGTPIVRGSGGNVQFKTPIALNAIDPSRMIIGGSSNLWESADQGTTVTHIASGVGINEPGAVAYGGTQGGVANEQVLYVGSGVDLFVRQSGSGAPVEATSYPGGVVQDIVLDPTDWAKAFVIDTDSVFATSDAGSIWADITGNLMSIAGQALRTIEFVPGPIGSLVVGGSLGVFSSMLDSLGTWFEVGSNLPNALVYELEYDAADDVLVAGTLGRGAWTMHGASTLVAGTPPTLVIDTLGGVQVGENGTGTLAQTTDTFTVALSDPPSSDVVVTVQSSDAGEATVSPLTLTFTPANYNVAQTVTVTGVKDGLLDGDQPVTVTVSVVDAQSDGLYSATADVAVDVTVRDVPLAPLVSGPTGSGQPQLPTFSFSDVAGETFYSLYLIDVTATPATVAYTNFAIAPDSTSFTLPAGEELIDGHAYRYFIRAHNDFGYSDSAGATGPGFTYGDFVVGSTVTAVPSKTAANSATATNPPTISWPAADQAATYEIYLINLETGAAAASVSGLTGTSYTPAASLPEARYRIFVRAWNALGTGGFGAPFDFTVGAAAVIPGTTTANSATATNPPTISWPAATGATSYEIYLINLNTGTVAASQRGIVGTSYTPAAALPEAQYRIFVRAWSSAGTGGFGGAFDFVVGAASAPAVPGNLSVTAADTPRPTLQWDAVAGATSYSVYYVDVDHNTVVAFAQFQTATSYTHDADLPEGTYGFYVRAHNAAGSSAFSGRFDFELDTTPAPPELSEPEADAGELALVVLNEQGGLDSPAKTSPTTWLVDDEEADAQLTQLIEQALAGSAQPVSAEAVDQALLSL